MLRLGLIFSAMVLALAAPAKATSEGLTLSIEPAAAPVLTIDAKDVPADELLAELGQRLDFAVARIGTMNPEATISGHYQGTLAELLPWLLRNQDYMLIFGQGAEGEAPIERVVLMNSKSAPVLVRRRLPVTEPATKVAQPAALPPPAAETEPVPAIVADISEPPPGSVGAILHQAVMPLIVKANAASDTQLTNLPVATQVETPFPTNQLNLAAALAETTRKAQENLQALMQGLETACSGGAC